MPVPDVAFDAYLRLGTQWPQLRTPLSAVLGRHFLGANNAPRELLDLPCDAQTLRAMERVKRLHAKFGIEAKLVSSEDLRAEWRKSANGLVYIILFLCGKTDHKRYNGYHDYMTRENMKHIESFYSDKSEEILLVNKACDEAVQLMQRELELSNIFRISFVDKRHQDAYKIKGYLNEHPCIRDNITTRVSFIALQKAIRLHILDVMEESLGSGLDHYPSRIRDGLAFGLDDLTRRRGKI